MIFGLSLHSAGRSLRCAALPLLLAALACNERPADLRVWRVSDHDHTDNPNSGQVQVDPSDAGAPAPPGLEDVTIVAWQQNDAISVSKAQHSADVVSPALHCPALQQRARVPVPCHHADRPPPGAQGSSWRHATVRP